MPREPATDKSFTYFALLEAFDKHGCPVCRLMVEYSQSYLDTLFYEQVNDVGLRRKLRDARGFCNWHAWQARKIASSALGMAIIANDLITEEITRLDDLLRGTGITRLQHPPQSSIAPGSLRAFIHGWHQKGVCPVCQIVFDHERHALETILNCLRDAEFARRFERSEALCILHTTHAAETNGSHPHLRPLLELQRRKYAHLVGELAEFCRKHDYRFSHESWGSESDSWLRAIELIAGKPEVFGNERHRRKLRNGATPYWGRRLTRLLRWVSRRMLSTPMKDRRMKGNELHPGLREDQSSDDGKE
jgi:Family of unknown function (DUF6062)